MTLENMKDKSLWFIAIGIFVFAIALQFGAKNYANGAYNAALEPISQADSISGNIADSYNQGGTQTVLIRKQFAIFSKRKLHYNRMMRYYYTNYYALNILLIIFSTLSTILIFVTAKSGWDNKSLHQKLALLSVITVASIAYMTQNVMNNQVNIKHNLNGYIFTTKQQLLILKNLNECSQNPGYVCTRLDTIVAGNYDSLVNNLQYFFDMDGTKLSQDPMKNISMN